MLRVVLDTNTIVSGVIAPSVVPGRLLQAARDRRFQLVASAPLVDEVLRALRRDRIRRKYQLFDEDIDNIRVVLSRSTFPLEPADVARGVATHPEDDAILATAFLGGAAYLVTGDIQLQRIGRYAGVAILSPRAFLDLLEAHAENQP